MNLAYLCHRIPFPPDKGDKIRSYHQVERLARNHRVHLFTLVDDDADLAHVAALRARVHRLHVERLAPLRARALSLRALATGEAMSVAYFRHGRLLAALRNALSAERFDAAVVFSSAMAPYLAGWDGPLVADFVDLDSAKWQAYADLLRPSPMRWLYAREAHRLRALEAAVAERADCTILCAAQEEADLRRFCRPRNAVTIPNGTDTDYFHPEPSAPRRADVVFTGAMDYRANADAVRWFAGEVFERVRVRRPDARLVVVGSNPAAPVRDLARRPGIVVTGRVPDVRPWLWSAAVAIAPLRVARGIQNKVLEALACGVPVVATGAALAGIGAGPGTVPGVVVEEDPARFAAAVLTCLETESGCDARRASGRAFVEERFRWEDRLDEFEDRIGAAVRSTGPGLAPAPVQAARTGRPK